MKQFKSRKLNRLNKYDYAISDIICAFKSKSTMEYLNYLKRNNRYIPANIWQRSFHDHIIRIDELLNNIRNYIINNPKTWELDENNINSLEVQAGLNPTG